MLFEVVPSNGEAEVGDALMRQGNFAHAYASYEAAARLEPGRPEHRYKLGLAALALQDPRRTEGHLLEAIKLDPNFVPAHYALARFYRTKGRTIEALRHGSKAHSFEPQNALIVTEYADGLLAGGRATEAWSLVEPWLTRDSASPALLALGARLAPRAGREEQALAAVLKALSNLQSTRDARELQSLHHAAAGLLDRAGRYDEAFAHARLFNEAGRTTRRPFDPVALSRWISEKINYLTRERVEALPHATHADPRPVFIVGMPRSGTSLVEQILASHPAVHALGELPHLSRIADRLYAHAGGQAPYLQSLGSLSLQIEALALEYCKALEPVPPGKAFVTDKMPQNFLHLELAALLVPNCRVIHCVRDARDTCVSCYLTDFEAGNEFKFDLSHLASFYRDYHRLMAHWEQVLPIPILRLRYEDLVQHTEEQVRRLLDFLGLPWDERCLRFYENDRPVLTASREQVRQPIYTSSIGRWKRYEKHLGPLLAALGPNNT